MQLPFILLQYDEGHELIKAFKTTIVICELYFICTFLCIARDAYGLCHVVSVWAMCIFSFL